MYFYKRAKGQKFGNVKIQCDGFSFASKLEASVYSLLKNRENMGEIKVLQVQDHVYLTTARILYIADFKCIDCKTNEIFHVESKGFETPEWRIKLRLWKHYGPGKLEVYMGSHTRPFLKETIIAK